MILIGELVRASIPARIASKKNPVNALRIE